MARRESVVGAAGEPAAPTTDSRLAMERSVAKQREAAEAVTGTAAVMEASIERQRETCERQARNARTSEAGLTPSAAGDMPEPLPEELSPARCEPLAEAQAGPLVEEAARREGLEAELLRALIETESRYLPCAVSRKGALGMMQLMPETAALLGVQDPFDPRQNVDAGARFLKQLLVRFDGDLTLALGAYNAGPSRVEEAGGVPSIPETVNYVHQILDRLEARRKPAAGQATSSPPAGRRE